MSEDAIAAGLRMALESNAELLGRVSIFEGLTAEQLSAIASKGKKTFFSEVATLLREDETGDRAYLVLTGLALTEPAEGSGLAVEMLEPGTLIGEMAMLVESVHRITVKAKVRVRALAIERSDLYEVMETDPSIAQHFSEKLVDRLLHLANDLRHMDVRFAALELSLDHTLTSVA